MKKLYKAIVARLTDQVPELKEIDFDMGQLDILALDTRPSVIFPCALIDISYPKCEDLSDDIQQVTAYVKIRLAFECPLPTDSRASEARRNSALEIFTNVDKTYASLQSYETPEFSAFSRRSQTPDNRYAGIKIIDMVFETTFDDLTAHQE
jgi:hypothetical protein